MDETVKQKAPSQGAYYVRIVGTLFVITALVAILLSLVNMLTKPTIDRLAEEKRAAAMSQVMPGADAYEATGLTGDGVIEVSAATKDGQLMGYCVQVETNGFGGALQLMVGVDASNTVTGVSILSHAETLNTDKHGWLIEQYAGRSGVIGVSKNASDDQNIQAISGATVTSKAVTRGVNSALAAVKGGAQ